jgi:uncharacterized protein YbaP (TraB family)
MKDFIKKLPLDLIFLIISYTYKFQDKSLLNDIVDYKKSKTILLESYYKYWIVDGRTTDPKEYANWLINDIFAYANDYNATLYGYIDKFYNIFLRNIFLQSNKEMIDKYVYNLEQKRVFTQINIFLGLLTIKERKDIIKIQF